MKTVTNLALSVSFALVGLGSAVSNAEEHDHTARKAAAEKCEMPKRGEGRPTAEQEACMTAAGFTKPTGGHHGGKHRATPRNTTPSEGGTTTETPVSE